MAAVRHWSDERVIDWIVCVSDSGIVESNAVIVRSFDPSAAQIIDEPLVAFISSWIVIVSHKYADDFIVVVNFCPVTHTAHLTITIPDPPFPPCPA